MFHKLKIYIFKLANDGTAVLKKSFVAPYIKAGILLAIF